MASMEFGVTPDGDIVLILNGVQYDMTVDDATDMAVHLLRVAFLAKMKQTARTN